MSSLSLSSSLPYLIVMGRLQIWRCSFPLGRRIYNDNFAAHRLEPKRNFNPVALYVCQESREETMKHYLLHRRPSDRQTSFSPRSPGWRFSYRDIGFLRTFLTMTDRSRSRRRVASVCIILDTVKR